MSLLSHVINKKAQKKWKKNLNIYAKNAGISGFPTKKTPVFVADANLTNGKKMKKKLKCLRCGHEWFPMIDPNKVKECPRCKDYNWNKPRIRKKNIRKNKELDYLNPLFEDGELT